MAATFRNLTAHIATHSPEHMRALSSLHLTPAQKDAMLHQVKMLGDPRMQSLGRDVALAIRDGQSQGSAGVKRQLMERLQPRFAEIRRLHAEFKPAALNGPAAAGNDFKMNLDLDHMRMVQNFGNHKGSWEIDMSSPSVTSQAVASRRLNAQAALLQTEQSMGIIQAVAEQVRIILDQVADMGAVFGSPDANRIPAWSRSLVGGVDVIAGMLQCVIDGMGNPSLMVVCPMRYASAMTDVFQSVSYLFGGGTNTATTTNTGTGSAVWPW